MSEELIEVTLPKWGMNMVEGTVAEWVKDVGDDVDEGDVIALIETDKVESELESPATGTIVEIRVPADEDAQVGDVLALIRPRD